MGRELTKICVIQSILNICLWWGILFLLNSLLKSALKTEICQPSFKISCRQDYNFMKRSENLKLEILKIMTRLYSR